MSSFDNSNSSNNPTPLNTTPLTVAITSRDLDVEDAEGHVLEAVEERHKNGSTISFLAGGSTMSDGSHQGSHHHQQDHQSASTTTSVEGEPRVYRAMSSLTNNDNNSQTNNSNNRTNSQRTSTSDPTPVTSGRESFRAAAQRVQRMNQLKRVALLSRLQAASARNLLQDIQEETETEAMLNNDHHNEPDGLMKDKNHKENPYAGVYDQFLLKADSSSDDENDDSRASSNHQDEERTLLTGNIHHHRTHSAPNAAAFVNPAMYNPNHLHSNGTQSAVLPLHNHDNTSSIPPTPHHARQTSTSSDYIATNNDGYMDAVFHANPSIVRSQSSLAAGIAGGPSNIHHQYSKQQGPSSVAGSRRGSSNTTSHRQPHCLPRWMREFGAMCHPFRVARNCQDILEQSFFLWVGVPCLLASMVFYYILEDYQIDFLPGEATLSWWLLFATRQTVTLGAARMTVYVCIDGFMLGTRLAVQTMGPLLTLTAATGKGWPLIMAAWGMWNFILLHGETDFQRNWLFFTRIKFFNQNYNGEMLNSSLYTRILCSAILGGLAVCAKRTVLALKFGRKQFAEFKPRLERILADVVLLSEIAGLAETTEQLKDAEDAELEPEPSWDIMPNPKKNKKESLRDFLWTQPDVVETSTSADESTTGGSTSNQNDMNSPSEDKGRDLAESIMADYGAPPAGKSASSPMKGGHGDPVAHPMARMSRMPRTESGRFQIKDMLDTWVEPDSKDDKATSAISIHDILKFRRALVHLDEGYLFGEAFGSTKNRDETIASTIAVYHRLLALAPGTDSMNGVLPFDVLALLTLKEDGTENLTKKRMIRRIFTPDRSGGLPLLAFVQACDKIYKRLRYFRASIRNASVIDGVLESLANGIFYFVLIMSLSSLMQLNPWALLVSTTSLLVSVSFALGSSVSKYVEGVLLIAVRRPFDLGDRIFISSAESLNPTPDVTSNSWFVEDITLTTTTLRAAKTNEVSTVNNWSISGSRIVNCARSANATVHFQFQAHLSMLEGNKLNQFRAALHKYVEEHPRVWDSIAYIRHDRFDADKERIDFEISIRHRSSWQESGRIKIDRSEIHRFVFELGNELGVHFATPVDQQVVYQGGNLKRGDNDNCYMRDLMKGSNINTF